MRPGGTPDNSPVFQRRVGWQNDFRPVGTAEILPVALVVRFMRADGTRILSQGPALRNQSQEGGAAT